MAEKAHCDICNRSFKNAESLEMHNAAKHPSANAKKKTESSSSGGSKGKVIAGVVVLAILVIVGFVIFSSFGSGGQYDTFAQCVTDSGAKMFGAYWCPHCLDQKDMFGGSWKNVDYIECSLPNRAGQTEECNLAGIQSYPTWEFGDGSRVGGAQSLLQLSQLTGCELVPDAE